MTSAMLSRLANAAHPANSTTYIGGSQQQQQQFHPLQQHLANTESEFSPSPTPERMLMEPLPPNTPTGGGPASGDYRFSVGKLPGWAKKQVEAGATAAAPNTQGPQGKGTAADFPKGRWAQRVGGSQGITVKSHYDSDSVIPFPPPGGAGGNENQPPPPQQPHSLGHIKQDFEHDDSEETLDYNSLSEFESQRGTPPFQGLQQGGGGAPRHLSPSQRQLLRHHGGGARLSKYQTRHNLPGAGNNSADDSSLGSFHNVAGGAGGGGTENDADIDEFSDGVTTQDDGGESTEPEHPERTMYFGQVDEKPSEYTVNAMDAEELRRSQRRLSKKPRGGPKPGRSAAESEDLSEDDDEDDEDVSVSTPNAESGGRSTQMSMHSVSSENVDLVGRRERFLKSNFESLSGAEDAARGGGGPSSGADPHNNSISNQYRENGPNALQRNARTIARAQSFRDDEQNRRREELQRRIEETRKKLQNIGYRSTMKGSQSISDLSNLPLKEDPLRGGVSGRASLSGLSHPTAPRWVSGLSSTWSHSTYSLHRIAEGDGSDDDDNEAVFHDDDANDSSSPPSSSYFHAAEDFTGTAQAPPPPEPSHPNSRPRPSTAPTAFDRSRALSSSERLRRGRPLDRLRKQEASTTHSNPDLFNTNNNSTSRNTTNLRRRASDTKAKPVLTASLSDSNVFAIKPDGDFEKNYLRLFGKKFRKHRRRHRGGSELRIKCLEGATAGGTNNASSSEDESSAARSDLDEYLQVLSACPDLGGDSAAASPSPPPAQALSRKTSSIRRRKKEKAGGDGDGTPKKKVPVTVCNNRRKRTVSECQPKEEVAAAAAAAKFALRQPCTNFPGAPSSLRQQMSLPLGAAGGPDDGAKGDSSGADTTVVSDFDSGGETFSQDSLNGATAEDKTNENDDAEQPSPTRRRPSDKRVDQMTASTVSYETDTSLDSSMAESREAALRRFLARRKEKKRKLNRARRHRRDKEIEALEKELKELEAKLAQATCSSVGSSASTAGATSTTETETETEDGELRRRQHWQIQQLRSWSMELYGNFTDNEKVRFSYENLMSSTSSLLRTPSEALVEQMPSLHEDSPLPPLQQQPRSLPVSESDATLADEDSTAADADDSHYFSMPEPVQSLVKRFLHPASSTHDRYSPKPTRRLAPLVPPSEHRRHCPLHPRNSLLPTSSPSTPTSSEYKAFPLPSASSARPPVLSRALSDPRSTSSRFGLNRRAQSLVNCSDGSGFGVARGAGGAVGVTSMWIPVTPQPTRRTLPSPSGPRRQSSLGSTGCCCGAGDEGPPVPRQANVGLAKRVLLQQVLLPSKAEAVNAPPERPRSTEPTSADPSGLRRACSLSDLNRPPVTRRILPAPPQNVSGKKTSSVVSGGGGGSPSKVKSHAQQHYAMTKRLSRDAVMSPSAEDHQMQPQQFQNMQPQQPVPSYMRSTASSNKKERPASGSPSGPQRRRSSAGINSAPSPAQLVHPHHHLAQQHPHHPHQTQSTSDLRPVGAMGGGKARPADDDSSSEENLQNKQKGRRSSSHERSPRSRGALVGGSVTNLSSLGHAPSHPNLASAAASSRSERDLSRPSAATKVRVRAGEAQQPQQPQQISPRRGKMKTTTMIVAGGEVIHQQHPSSSSSSNYASLEDHHLHYPQGQMQVQQQPPQLVDVVRAPLNRNLAETTASALRRAAADLVQLYKRISLDHELEEEARVELLRSLSSAAGAAQGTLRPVVPAAVTVTDLNAPAAHNSNSNDPSTPTAKSESGGESESGLGSGGSPPMQQQRQQPQQQQHNGDGVSVGELVNVFQVAGSTTLPGVTPTRQQAAGSQGPSWL